MPRFDAVTKELIQSHPADWLEFLGLPAKGISIVDSDLSTVSADADKILVVRSEPSYIAHIEMQSTYAPDDAERFMGYNVLASRKHHMHVRTVVFLLRPEADGPCMRMPLVRQFPDEPPYIQFIFRVIRVWEQPVDAVLQAGIGTLPLAPLCRVSREDLPDLIGLMERRIDEAAPADAGILWTAAFILLGLRYPSDFAVELLKGVRAMKESSTYQAILEEGEARGRAEGEARGRAEGEARGRAEGERAILIRLGTKRYGEPNAQTLAMINSISSVDRLEAMSERLLEAESWVELLR